MMRKASNGSRGLGGWVIVVPALAALAIGGQVVRVARSIVRGTSPRVILTGASAGRTYAAEAEQQCTSSPTGAVPFLYPPIVNSNGYNTYVDQDMWAANAGTTQKTCALSPGHWSVTADAGSTYTGVQTYPNVQELFTDWSRPGWPPTALAMAAIAAQAPNLERRAQTSATAAKRQAAEVEQVITEALQGSGWNGSGTMTATPISALHSLSSTYATTNPSVGDFEAAYDIWLENTPDTEVMIWVYNVNRGTGGVAVAAHTTLFGGPVTLLHDNGANEIILSLDNNQASGTIDLLSALKYLQGQGLVSSTATLGQIDFGWEICNTGGQNLTFGVTRYSIRGS